MLVGIFILRLKWYLIYECHLIDYHPREIDVILMKFHFRDRESSISLQTLKNYNYQVNKTKWI